MLHIFCLLDSTIGEYLAPIFYASEAAAKRAILSIIKSDLESIISKFPADFSLHYLGHFDPKTGEIQPCSHPVHICRLDELATNGVKSDA